MIFQTGETAQSSFWGNLTQSELRAGSGAGVEGLVGKCKVHQWNWTTWGHLHQVGHIARIFCVYLRQVKHNQLSVGWKWFIYKNIEIQFQDHSCLMSLCICQGINLIGDQFTALRNHSLQWDKSQMFRQHELIETFWSDTHVWCPMSYTQYPTIHGNFMEWGPVDSIFCECNW